MKARIIGIAILVVVVGGALLYQFVLAPRLGLPTAGGTSVSAVTLKALVGSEKSNLLEDTQVKDLMARQFGISIDYRRAGSIEMMSMDQTGIDFLWPSSRSAQEVFSASGKTAKKTEIAFSSPIVFYSWNIVGDALAKAGLVRDDAGVSYVDLAKLLDAAISDKTWKDLGLSQLNGKVTVTTTDPKLSNSGYQFAGLVANVFFNDLVDKDSLDKVMPKVKELFRRQGLMEHSTGTLFERYLQLGVGSFPIIVAYENQITEFALENPDLWKNLKTQIRLLYPSPTVYSEHPVLALSDNGTRMIEAIQNPEFLKLAWNRHGFRTGLENDPASLGLQGIPKVITNITRMPTADVMQSILDQL